MKGLRLSTRGGNLPVGEADAYAGFVLSIFQIGLFGCFDGHHVTVCWHRRTEPFTVDRCQ